MPLGFVSIGQSALNCGADPWSAADALVGLPRADDSDSIWREAGPGGPARTGGPPHNLCRIRSLGKTKWHWAECLPVSRSYFFLPCAATASIAALTFSGSPR